MAGTAATAGPAYARAAFAFQLAREKTGNKEATYRTEGGRSWLMEQPEFRAAFEEAKARIRGMEYRYDFGTH